LISVELLISSFTLHDKNINNIHSSLYYL
jgi:hypothetical protein